MKDMMHEYKYDLMPSSNPTPGTKSSTTSSGDKPCKPDLNDESVPSKDGWMNDTTATMSGVPGGKVITGGPGSMMRQKGNVGKDGDFGPFIA